MVFGGCMKFHNITSVVIRLTTAIRPTRHLRQPISGQMTLSQASPGIRAHASSTATEWLWGLIGSTFTARHGTKRLPRYGFQIADDIYNLKTIPCNECNYCMLCPYGIDIPAILSHYNKCIKENNMPNKGSQHPGYKRARRAFLIGYDRSVPKLRQASHCIGCGQCTEHCPQRINIPKELQKIDQFVEELKTASPQPSRGRV